MARTFERTHPWINFSLDLRRAQATTWMLLGEAQSKVQHVAGIPLPPGVQQQFLEIYMAKGVLATTAIEGNTLSEEEVRAHLRGELTVPPSKAYLQQEIENVVAGCNHVGDTVFDGQKHDVRVEDLLEYNRLVLKGLPVAEEVRPGELRRHGVGVGTYRGAPAEDLRYLVEELCRWLASEHFAAPKGFEIATGILKAIVAHVYVAWIHPFGDGNGRTARLLELRILLSVGVPVVAAHLLSNHYNQTRSEYYRQLDVAHKSKGDLLPFIHYAVQGFVDQLRQQIQTIKDHQLTTMWINFIHERFQGRDTPAGIRQRHLALDLSAAGGEVETANVRHLTPRLAEAYAGKTEKTVKRDLNALEEMGLLVRKKSTVRAKWELILAFLPAAVEGTEASPSA